MLPVTLRQQWFLPPLDGALQPDVGSGLRVWKSELEPSSGMYDMRRLSVFCRTLQFNNEHGKGMRKINLKPEF